MVSLGHICWGGLSHAVSLLIFSYFSVSLSVFLFLFSLSVSCPIWLVCGTGPGYLLIPNLIARYSPNLVVDRLNSLGLNYESLGVGMGWPDSGELSA